MRAMADNEDLARITGIPTERVIRATWVIGGGLTGIAGFVYVLWKGTLVFNDGWLLLLLVFAAVILGGIGSIYGAITGGLIIGLVNSLSIIWIPSDFARAAAFGAMIVILLVKPQGLFSGRSTA
jgi:branched-chain amino acid transport system permease protein